MRSFARWPILLLIALGLPGCEENGEQVLGVSATGTVIGFAFLDRDGDLRRTNVDVPYANLRISILPFGGGATLATVTSDTAGLFRFPKLPVGTYRLEADAASLGDSVRIMGIDSARLTVGADDSVGAIVTIGLVTTTVVDIAKLPRGRRVTLVATALNSWATFGDSTVHVADSTGAIRLVGLRPLNVTAGDILRLTASVTERDGLPALTDPTVITRVVGGNDPTPTDVTTAQAAAAGGKLSSGFVRIKSAVVLEASSLTGGDVLLTVDDRSGPVEVLLDANAGIVPSLPITRGAELDVSGILVPIEGNPIRWRLKPRRSLDLTVRYPPVSIRTAKTRQVGQIVVVQGIALTPFDNTGLGIFGDQTIHVADSSASIRVFANPASFIAGDSINVVGTIALRDGQKVLINATPSVIVRRTAPAPRTIKTVLVATADTGRLDAALVRITNALVTDTGTVNGELHLALDDSSGVSEIVLDRDVFVSFPRPAIGSRMTVTGLLVPSALPGLWFLKPRSAAELTTTALPPPPASQAAGSGLPIRSP